MSGPRTPPICTDRNQESRREPLPRRESSSTGQRSSRRALLRRRRPEDLDRPGQQSRLRKETLAGYGFLVPWLIGFFGLTLLPMAYSLYLSFTNYNIFSPPKWIGLNNYIRMFTDDPSFMQSAQITLIYVLVGTPITLAAALGVAMLLNFRDKGAGFFRSSFYAPSLIGGSVSAWRSCGGRCSPTTARSTTRSASSGSTWAAGSATPTWCSRR